MAKRLDGKKLAEEIKDRLKDEIDQGLKQGYRAPGLAVIRVGDDPASEVYVSNKEKACSKIGIKNFGRHLPANSSEEEILNLINSLNSNDFVDGILLQLPLPKGIDEGFLLNHIDPEKDADGLHPINLGKLLKGQEGPRPCTPSGVMALLSKNSIDIESKKAVVIGRSILVGKPMALMLQAANATVTVAHSRTKDLVELTRNADLLVVAAGKPQLIDKNYVRSNSVLIDVGIHRLQKQNLNGSEKNFYLCGDIRFEEVEPLVRAITPVPGGVGPMTVAMLLVNTVKRWEKDCGLSFRMSDLFPND